MNPIASITLMTRLPRAGETKTRLIPHLGSVGAATLQADMTAHIARQLRVLRACDQVHACVSVTGGSAAEVRSWLRLPASEQSAGDLGSRQMRALEGGLSRAEVAAVIGADCPTVDAGDIRRAIEAARERGVAIIAAQDGGYCLLATTARSLSAVACALGPDIRWGSDSVLDACLGRLRANGVEPAILGPRADVDVPADLPAWESVRDAWYGRPRSVAVIIPVLNEANALPVLLERLRDERARIIVVDGGSRDDTVRIAREAGVTVLEREPGRGGQMNAGAEATDADALLFLHADTLPPSEFVTLLLDALADPQLLVGAFRFSLDARSASLKIIQAGTRLRGSIAHFPYGDQGLFCRRVVWQALGGFPEIPMMEDYEFVRRARHAGTVRVLHEDAITSDRRWREHGPWRWTALNLLTAMRYRLGASPARLATWRADQKR